MTSLLPHPVLPPRLPRVDGRRLLRHVAQLGAIGATPESGVTRQAFSRDDARARELVTAWMKEAGLRVRVDPAGNIIGELDGLRPDLPVLVLGSHVDTVPNGGTLDGAYGVLAAIEVARALTERKIRLDRTIAVIAFADEEGTPELPAFFGSKAVTGMAAELLDEDTEKLLADALAAVGGDLDRLDQAVWPPGSISAYLELHIEQGPVLESHGISIGVVEAITGRTTIDIRITGAANHSGTTPMSHRKDALVAAASVILAVRALADSEMVVRVATVGRCLVEPNAWNVVPGGVQLTVDLRDTSMAAIDTAVCSLRRTVNMLAVTSDIAITFDVTQVIEPTECDPGLRDLIASTCKFLQVEYIDLPSGAGHDAQIIGRVAPVGMIFVPSAGGVSHSPAESTDPDDLVLGADLLLHIVLEYDMQEKSHP